MRFIDMRQIEVPAAWAAKAAKLTQKLYDDFAAGKRPKFSNEWWRDDGIRSALIALSIDKCWYCETRVDGNNPDVDHWRPKARVRGVSTHQGYWWLAYEPFNLRISCRYCNSSSRRRHGLPRPTKMDHFRLVDEAARVFHPSASCEQEKPLLLDPTVAADCALLAFTSDGRVAPDPLAPGIATETCRPTHTINLLDLNRAQLRERRAQAVRTVSRLACLLATASGASVAREELAEQLSPHSPYSRAMHAALRAHRHIPSVDATILTFLVEYDAYVSPTDPVATGVASPPERIPRIRRLVAESDYGQETAELYEDGRCRWGARTYGSLQTVTVVITGDNTIDPHAFWKEELDGTLQELAHGR